MNMMKKFLLINLLIVLFCFPIGKLYSDISDIVFDDTQVHEFYLTFEQQDFWEQMLENYSSGLNEYIPSTFEFNGEIYDSVGVRFKGNASMANYPSNKKPFKIKFNEYIEDQEFYEVSKLSLSNEYLDPSFLREKIMYDYVNECIPSSRTNFIKLFINGDYWGLYTNVEQIDQVFIDRTFGSGENGNLFKGDPQGTLEWLGEDPEPYYSNYELKTNEVANDWSDLIHFIDILNNTNIDELQDSLETVFHIHNFLFFSALNNFFVNLDSYICKGHNFYLYNHNVTDKFVHIPWDFNLSFGNFTGGLSTSEILDLSIYWTFEPTPRPLIDRMFQISDYNEIYEMNYKYILDNLVIEEELFARIDLLVNLIRPAVYADTLKMFSNEDFETSINEDIISGYYTILGIKPFITARIGSVENQLMQLEIRNRTDGLFINEFMADNETTISDEFDEYDDWVEIYNSNSESVNMEGLFLTDDPSIPDKWQFPEVEIPANSFLLVWTDDDEEQGELHTNFRLNTDGEFIGLYEIDGIIPLDTLSYGYQEEDISFGRDPDGDDNWVFMDNPSPGYSNNYVVIDVDFIGEPLTGLVPLDVQFTDISIGDITSWEWDFDNDGTIDSNEQNPLFTYLETGIYSVSLTVFDEMNTETETKIDYITVGEPIIADFIAEPLIGLAPLEVQFADLSSGGLEATFNNVISMNIKSKKLRKNIIAQDNLREIVAWEWDFDNDGTIDSNEQNPLFTYLETGIYSVSLTVSDGITTETETKNDYIEVTETSIGNDLPTYITDLYKNHPNPFNPTTTIKFSLKEDSNVSIKIYNIIGATVRTLIDEEMKAAYHEVIWDGKNTAGKQVGSGFYFCKMVASNGEEMYSSTMKMLLLK